MLIRSAKQGLLSLLIIVSLIVVGCGAKEMPTTQNEPVSPAPTTPSGPKLRDELKVRVGIDVSNMLPGLLNNSTETGIALNVYSGLLKFNQGTTEVVPDLAEKWETSADGLTYTFHLRKGVKWHKGFGELTSKDVKYSFDWILDKNNASPWIADLENVAAVETPDDYTVVIKMKKPQPSFPVAVLAYRPGLIVNRAALGKFGKDYNANVVGTGPFVFEQWVPGDRAVLKANPDYYGAKPKVQTVTFLVIKEEATFEAALEKGDVDIGYTEDGSVGSRLAKNPKLDAQMIPGPRTWYLQFNLNHPPLNDVRVRQAIWWSLKKDDLVAGVFNGSAKATDTLLNTWVQGRLDEQPYKQDLAKAKELLRQAGLENGFKVTLHTYTTATAPDQAAIIKEQLAQVGITVDIKVVEWSNLTTIRRAGNFEISLQPHLRLETDQYFYPILHSGSIPFPNAGGYKGLDDLIDKSRSELNDKKRQDLYHQIQRKIHEEAPVIPLLHPSFVLAYRPNVKGAVAANLTYNLVDISVEE